MHFSDLGGGPPEKFNLDEEKEAHLDQMNANHLVYPNQNDTDQPKKQSPNAAHVVDVDSTQEEDETMEELNERPSKSFPTEIDQDQPLVPSEESNSMDHVENQTEVLTDGQRLELSTSSTNEPDLMEKEVQSITTTTAPAPPKTKRINVRNIQVF